MLILMKGRINT